MLIVGLELARTESRDQPGVAWIAAQRVAVASGDGGVEDRGEMRPQPIAGVAKTRCVGGVHDGDDVIRRDVVNRKFTDHRVGPFLDGAEPVRIGVLVLQRRRVDSAKGLSRLLESLGCEIRGLLAVALDDRVDAPRASVTAALAASRALSRLTTLTGPSPMVGRLGPSW